MCEHFYTFVDGILVIACALLPDVALDAHGGYKEFLGVPACCCVAEEGQGGGIVQRLVSGYIKAGMRGRQKGSYGPAQLAQAHLAGGHIYAYAAAAGQLVQIAAIRQFYPVLLGYWHGIPATAPYSVEGGVFEYVAVAVGVKDVWLHKKLKIKK